MKIFRALVLVLSSLSGCGTCPGFCSPRVHVQLVDADGMPIQPTTGTVTIDGVSTAFSCRRGGETPDGGLLTGRVACTGSSIEFSAHSFTRLALSINDDLGRSFSGDVPFTLVDSGSDVCGSKCRYANTKVTVQ